MADRKTYDRQTECWYNTEGSGMKGDFHPEDRGYNPIKKVFIFRPEEWNTPPKVHPVGVVRILKNTSQEAFPRKSCFRETEIETSCAVRAKTKIVGLTFADSFFINATKQVRYQQWHKGSRYFFLLLLLTNCALQ